MGLGNGAKAAGSAQTVFLIHPQGVEVFFPLFIARRLMDAERGLVVVEIIFAIDRLRIPRILGDECRLGAHYDANDDERQDDDDFHTHGSVPYSVPWSRQSGTKLQPSGIQLLESDVTNADVIGLRPWEK